MLNRILAATVFTATLAIAGISSANADEQSTYNHNSRSSAPYQTAHSDDGHGFKKQSNRIVISRKLNRRVVNDTLPVRKLLDLDRSYRGYRVKTVRVKVKPHRSHGRIKLLVNGHTVDRDRIDENKWITLRTDGDKTIGRDLRSLKLRIRGKALIKNVEVTLAKPRRPRHHAAAGRAGAANDTPNTVKYSHIDDPVFRILRVILHDVKIQSAAL